MTRPALRVVHDIDAETGEVMSCPMCVEAHAESEVWERRVLELERKVKRLTEDRDEKIRQDQHYPAAIDLIDEWKRECGHPKARVDMARINLAMRAIKLYKDDRKALSWVIQYGKHLAYVDPKGTRHDGFGLLFRDAEHIEKYANAYVRWARANGVEL